ncbi:hypothetical protein C0J52_20506 [Blattella germanica]|nr:hypothetical protein C0J52_20506 [Blattella germanica]
MNYLTYILPDAVYRKLHYTERWSIYLATNTTFYPLNSYKNYIIFIIGPLSAKNLYFVCMMVNLYARFIIILVLNNKKIQKYDTRSLTGFCFTDVLIISWKRDKIVVKTILPYQLPGQCGKLNKVIDLDTWIQGDKGGTFYSNAEFKLSKMPKVLKCCKFVDVMEYDTPPYTFIKNNSDGNEYEGADVRLLKLVNEALTNTENCTEIGEIEAANTIRIPNLIGMYYRRPYPYRTLKYTYFVPKAASYPRWAWFTRVFTNSLWASYITSLVTVAITLKYISYFKYRGQFESYRSVSYYLICIWSIFVNTGIKNIPTSISFRLVVLSWIVYSVSVSTVFQVFVTSYFVFQIKEHQIDTLEELQNEGYTLIFDNEFKYVINYSNKSFYFYSPKEALLYFLNTRKTALYTTEEFFKFSMKELCSGNEINDYHMMKKHEDSNNYNGIITENIIFQNRINNIFKKLATAGIVQKIFDDIVHPTGRTNSENVSGLEYQDIDITCLQSSFYVLITGLCLSLILFLFEVTVKTILITNVFRLVVLSWIVYSVSVSTVFQVFVTSYFVFQIKEHQIDTLEELQNEGYTLIFDNEFKYVINYSNKSFYFYSPKEALLYFLNTRKTALYTTEEFFKFSMKELCSGNEINDYHMMKKHEDSNNYNGIITENIIFQNRINNIFKKLATAGIVQKIFDDIVHPTGRTNSENVSGLEYQDIDITCLQSSFYVLITGLCLSLILFLFEVTVKTILITNV